VSLGEKFTVFQRIVVPTSSVLRSPRRMKTLKIKTPRSFEMLGTTHPLICHIPEYLNLRLLKLKIIMYSMKELNDRDS